MNEKDRYYFLAVKESGTWEEEDWEEIHNWLVVGQHPIIWLAKKRKDHPGHRFTILFWAEIPEDIAREHGRIQWRETGKFSDLIPPDKNLSWL